MDAFLLLTCVLVQVNKWLSNTKDIVVADCDAYYILF